MEFYDRRCNLYSTFFGDIGMLGGPDARELTVVPETLDALSGREMPDIDLPDFLPAVLPVEPDKVPDELNRSTYGRNIHVLSHSNYLRRTIRAQGFLEAMSMSGNFRESFLELNGGLSPEEILFCLWVADFLEKEIEKAEPIIWGQLRSAGFCSYNLERLRTMWTQVAKDPQFGPRFSSRCIKHGP